MKLSFSTGLIFPPLGIRVFYVTRKWELRSRLLAVRQFNPDAEKLKSTRLSGILEEYLKTVLSEFQLSVSNLFSATTDSGSDVKRLCDVLLPGLWEWCVCHMLNCALVEVRVAVLWCGARRVARQLQVLRYCSSATPFCCICRCCLGVVR